MQKIFRTFSLNHADLTSLEQAAKLLDALNDILARQELKHACQTGPLIQQIRSTLTRLENVSPQEGAASAIVLPPQALASATAEAVSTPISRLVYVIQPEPEVNAEVIHETLPPLKRVPVFLAGACSALILGAIALWGWNYAHRADDAPQAQALTASVMALPQALNAEQINTLRETEGGKTDPALWLKHADSQLNALAALPVDWALQYGHSLLSQANALWPENPQVVRLQQQWQQKLAASALPINSLTGWHDGMQQLQGLVDKLNTLDGQKGKYLTVSELKSSVYEMMNSFRQTVPLEEQLRLLENQRGEASLATQQQIQMHFNGLAQEYSKRDLSR